MIGGTISIVWKGYQEVSSLCQQTLYKNGVGLVVTVTATATRTHDSTVMVYSTSPLANVAPAPHNSYVLGHAGPCGVTHANSTLSLIFLAQLSPALSPVEILMGVVTRGLPTNPVPTV